MSATIPSKLRRFFLARSTVTSLLAAILAAVVAASLIPQAFITAPPELMKWQAEHPAAAAVAPLLGLHHLYTSPLFAGILLLAMVSLVISTVEQGGRAWRRTFALPVPPPSGQSVASTEAIVGAVARQAAYIPMSREGGLRFVRHPWGYWGGFLLHLGLVVTVAASLIITMTQQRGSLVLVEGEPHFPDEPWTVEENGLLAGPLHFGREVRLVQVMPVFHPTGKTAAIESKVSFTSAAGAPEMHGISVNRMVSVDGTHVYQSTDFGHAFRVDFTDRSGETGHFTLPMYHPQSLHEPGFREFRLPVSPLRLDAKYIVDESGTSMMQGKPVLTLRLMDGEREVSRAVLRPGDTATLDPFRVTLTAVTTWSELIFVHIHGMGGVFGGFALCILGAVLGYCCPPRELVAVPDGVGFKVFWRAEKFPAFYAEEGESLLERCAGGET